MKPRSLETDQTGQGFAINGSSEDIWLADCPIQSIFGASFAAFGNMLFMVGRVKKRAR